MFADDVPSGAPPSLPGPSSSMGTSPDGIGAYAQPLESPVSPPQSGGALTYQPSGSMHGPMHGEWDAWEPDDTSQTSAVRSAGFTALLATVSVGIGIAAGGPWGAGAGLLLAGSLMNGYRAQKWWGSAEPSEKHEAVVSAVFGAFGLAGGLYMGYKAYEARK